MIDNRIKNKCIKLKPIKQEFCFIFRSPLYWYDMLKRVIVVMISFFPFLPVQAQKGREQLSLIQADSIVHYTRKEQELVDWFDQLLSLNMIYAFNLALEEQGSLDLQFKILKKPSPGYPYFLLQGYIQQQPEKDAQFIVDVDKQKVFHVNYSGKWIPLSDWGQQELMNIRAYYKARSQIAPKYDLDRGLLELEVLHPPIPHQ